MDDHAINAAILSRKSLFLLILLALLVSACAPAPQALAPPTWTPAPADLLPTPLPASATAAPPERSVRILVDDFAPQTYAGEPTHYYNRLGGDRGSINSSTVSWDAGQVTTTVAAGNSWGGVWMSLNHPLHEGLPLNFSALLPAQILPAYQSRITGMSIDIASSSPGRLLRLELKDRDELRWSEEITLSGGPQLVSFDLPALGDISQLVWVIDRASAGDRIVLDTVSFSAKTAIDDTATAAFVWSYAMLLNNWSPATGLVRDKAKHASGEFDAIQASGSLAAATAMATQLGVIERSDAIEIVDRIGQTLLVDTPRFHGLWPHFVNTSASGTITIAPYTEWSSIDTVIAAVGLLSAQNALGLDSSGTEQMLRAIDWADLTAADGMIGHGYAYSSERLSATWNVFGGESWLVGLAHAGATGRVAPIASPLPPTANGAGFIDELAWLFALPPSSPDHWQADWAAYRSMAADRQLAYYNTYWSTSCFSRLGLFGLSAAEVPSPATPVQGSTYQAFGVGGQFGSANDGAALLGAPAITPHYAAMIASLRPEAALRMWSWLIDNGLFSPLTNVESAIFPAGSSCGPGALEWNSLKGSWNLSLQTLGWGRYLAERSGQIPVLWQATTANPLLSRGYALLASNRPAPTATPPWRYERECENPDDAVTGQLIQRSNASGRQVHGQFGSGASDPWPAKPGYVQYTIDTPQLDQLYLELRYSKYSPAATPIQVYLDDEPAPRATIYPIDQGSWNQFAWSGQLLLGSIDGGVHTLRFATNGQKFGVADLDRFILSALS